MKFTQTIFGCLFFLHLMGSAVFAADTNAVSRQEFMKMLNELKRVNGKVDKLSEENQQLREEINTLRNRQSPVDTTDINTLKEDVEEISELLPMIEKRTLLDKIQIGAELRTRADWFDFKERVPVRGRSYREGHEEEVHALMSNRFRLNLKAEISKNLQFHGRLTMYKNWMDVDFAAPLDYKASRMRTDNDLNVERAYIDYFFSLHEKLPMALSFGRLPMADGLPTDLREDTPRKATFPSLSYDIEGDGLGLSIMLDKLTGLKKSAFRFIYLRQNDDNDIYPYRTTELDLEESNIYISQFETMLPGSYFKDILFILNFIAVPDLPSMDLTGQGLNPVDLPDSQGSMWYLTVFAEAKNFLGTGFDWFAGFSYFDLDADGGPVKYRFGPVPVNITFNNRDNYSEKSARAFHVGLRYTIPVPSLNRPKFGIEYNRGSKYWLSNTSASEDPLNKLATRGYAWDFYYIQPINRYLTARFGHTFVRDRYKMGMSGPKHVRQKIKNTYLLLDARF